QVIEARPAGFIEADNLTIENAPLRQSLKQRLEAPHPVALLTQQPAVNGVGYAPESVELELERPVRIIEWLSPHYRNDRVHTVLGSARSTCESTKNLARGSRRCRLRNLHCFRSPLGPLGSIRAAFLPILWTQQVFECVAGTLQTRGGRLC